MVSNEPRSGYEIKAVVDGSTRFFWAASYGQIYPELKRLAEAGLVERRRRPARRAQAHRLRDHRRRRGGAEGLAAPAARDLRDARGRAAEAVLRRRAAARGGGRDPARDARRTGSRSTRSCARSSRWRTGKDDPFPLMVLRGGIEFNEWFADWCERMEAAAPRRPTAREKEQLMFDALARLADGNARRIGLLAIALLPPRRRARRLGRRPPRPLRRRRPGDRDGRSARAAAGRRAASAGGDRRGRGRAGRRAAATRARVEALERSVARRADVASVTGYYDTRSPAFVSDDGSSTYFAVALKPTDDKEWQDAGGDDRRPALRPARASSSAAPRSPRSRSTSRSRRTCRTAEMLAFPLLFLLSLLFFRSLVAALLPLMIGGLAIVGTFLILRLASEFGSISIFALNLTTALGLGLAIDYSLFIVSRYREEIAKDGPGPGGDAARAGDRRAHRLLLLADGRRGARLAARLPPALPLLDGPRRRAGGAVRGADLADRAAGGADPARARGSTPAPRSSCSAAPRPTPGPTSTASGTGSRAS